MKQIYILRHAKSSWKNLNLNDFDRPLAKRGINDSIKLNNFIKKNNYDLEKVICSNAKRAKDTFDLVADSFNFSIDSVEYRDDLYYGNTNTIVNLLKGLDSNIKNILIVGHNPSLHSLVEQLTTKKIYKFSTCSLAIVSFEESWDRITDESCDINLYIKPKEIKN